MADKLELKVEKLDNGNFYDWEFSITLVLKAAQLFSYVLGKVPKPTEAEKLAEWTVKDSQAMAKIVTTISRRHLGLIKSCKTSQAMWEKLKKTFDDRSILTKSAKLKEWFNFEIRENESLMDGFARAERIISDLESMQEHISDENKISRIISSLPPSMENFVLAWESVTPLEQSMDNLQLRLRRIQTEREQKRGESNAAYKSRACAVNQPYKAKYNGRDPKKLAELKKKMRCRNCNEFGHWASECTKPRKPNPVYKRTNNIVDVEKKLNARAFLVNDYLPRDQKYIWQLDSGATSNTCGQRALFATYTDVSRNDVYIYVADKSPVKVYGIGDIVVEAWADGQWQRRIIQDVKYIPGFENLISARVFVQKNYKIVTTNEGSIIYDENEKEVAQATLQDNVFVMLFRTAQKYDRANATKRNTLWLWHNRLSHVNCNMILETQKKNAVIGLDFEDQDSNFVCEPCLAGKMTRMPHPPASERRKYKPGEVIHADLAGPMDVESLQGNLYFLLIKDDNSGHRTAYFLKLKSEVEECIRDYINLIENHVGVNVKILRTDNGSEFGSNDLAQFLSEKGIIHERSAPYTPEQNGRIEREIRTIKDSTRTMLESKDLPESLWEMAVSFACYVRNRVLDKQSPEITAYEAMFKRKPIVSHIRIFGSDAYVNVPKVKRKGTWDTRGKRLIFVGFIENSTKNFKLYDPERHSIGVYHMPLVYESYLEKVVTLQCPLQFETTQATTDGQHEKEHDGDTPPPQSTDSDGRHTDSDSSMNLSPLYTTKLGETNQSIADEPEAEQLPSTSIKQSPKQSIPMSTTTTAQANYGDSLNLIVLTGDQQYTVNPPLDEPSEFVIPGPHNVNYHYKVTPKRKKAEKQLRDRGQIKSPRRLQIDSKKKSYANVVRDHIDPNTYEQAMDAPDHEMWQIAMTEEVTSLLKKGTWTLVEKPPNAKIIGSKWVYKIKRNPDGSVAKYKARLVARGFNQKYGIDFDENFSPVARYETVRLFLAIAASEQMQIAQIDIKNAYINGILKEEVYLQQPKGFEDTGRPNLVCKLSRAIYGLPQSGKYWYDTFTDTLMKFGLIKLNSDPCAFIGNFMEETVRALIYVDDCLIIAKSMSTINTVIEKLKAEFELTVGSGRTFLGIEIHPQPDGSITITQQSYIQKLLNQFEMDNAKDTNVPMQPGTVLNVREKGEDRHEPYRELIGALLYLCTTSRPDIAYAVSRLSRNMVDFSIDHWKAAKYILRYLKSTQDFGITYKANAPIDIIGYADSDFAMDPATRRSTTGYTFMNAGSAITWCSQRQSLVTVSTTEAELVATSAAAKEAMWLRTFLTELGFPQRMPTTIFVDNQAAINLGNSHEYHRRTKHIEVKHFFVREMVSKKHINLEYVNTNDNLADSLTKPLLATKFNEKRTAMNITKLQQLTEQRCRPKNTSYVPIKPLLLLTLLALIHTTNAFVVHKIPPIVWYEDEKPVTKGYSDVQILALLVSPCTFLNNETIHEKMLESAQKECDLLYERKFLNELEKLCPIQVDKTSIARTQTKRAIALFGWIVGIVIAAVASSGFGLSISNKIEINKMTEVQKQQEQMLAKLQNQTDLLRLAIEKLENATRDIASDLYEHEKQHERFIQTIPGSIYAISHVTAELELGQMIIRTTRRKWKRKHLHPPFLDHLNITLPCGDECPLQLATPISCSLNPERNRMKLHFAVPNVYPNVTLLRPEAFRLMKRTKSNQTCTLTYNGFNMVIYNGIENCIYPLATRHDTRMDLTLIPNVGCRPGSVVPDTTQHYTVQSCADSHEGDQEDFIQLKYFNEKIYVYCPESTFEIDNRKTKCPDMPFEIPANQTFKINHYEYHAERIVMKHKMKVDPAMNFRINYDLKPTLNIDKIMNDLDEADEAIKKSKEQRITEWHFFHTNIYFYLFLCVVSCYALNLICKRCQKPWRNSIRWKPNSKRVQINVRRMKRKTSVATGQATDAFIVEHETEHEKSDDEDEDTV